MNHFRTKLHEYRQYLDCSTLNASSRRQYHGHATKFIKWVINTPELSDENLSSVETAKQAANCYVQHLCTDHELKAGSINSILTALTHFFRAVYRIDLSPQRLTETPVRPKTLAQPERDRLLHVLDRESSPRERLLVMLFLMAGLRACECANLDLSDVDLDSCTLTIGRKQPRIIPLNSALVRVFREWTVVRPQCACPAVFLTRDNRRLSIPSIDNFLKSVGRRARLDLSPQLLRNTCIQSLLSAGADSLMVATITGADPATLQQFLYLKNVDANLLMETLVYFTATPPQNVDSITVYPAVLKTR